MALIKCNMGGASVAGYVPVYMSTVYHNDSGSIVHTFNTDIQEGDLVIASTVYNTITVNTSTGATMVVDTEYSGVGTARFKCTSGSTSSIVLQTSGPINNCTMIVLRPSENI